MPEPQPQPAPPPVRRFAPGEALGYGFEGGKQIAPTGVAGIDVLSQGEVQLLRDYRTNATDPASMMERLKASATKETTFRQQDAKNLKDRFITNEVKKQAGELAEQNFNFVQYSEIFSEAARTGKTPEDVAKAKGLDYVKWRKLRDSVLDRFLGLDVVHTIAPEMNQITNIDAKRDLLEAALATDPKIRAKVIESMQEIAQKARGLPGIDTEDTARKKHELAVASQELDQRLGQLLGQVDQLGIKLSNPEQKALADSVQQALLVNGENWDDVSKSLLTELLSKSGVTNLAEVQEYGEAEKAREEARKNLTKAPKDPAHTLRIEAEADYAKAKKRFDDAEKKGKKISTFDDQRKKYQAILKAVRGETDAAGNVTLDTSSVGHTLSELVKTGDNILRINNDLSQPAAGAEGEARKNAFLERMSQEADLLRDLESVMPNAIVNTIVEREREMGLSWQANEGKMRDDNLRTASAKVRETQAKRLIEDNEIARTRTYRANNIGEDMKYLVYRGEEGAKRMMLRDMGEVNWRTADLDALPDAQKQTLNALYDQMGENYTSKIFTSYFMASRVVDQGFIMKALRGRFKGIRVEGSFKNISLKEFEWEKLGEQFGEKLGAALNKSKEGKQILENLKAQGVTPGFRLKWIMYLLATLGIIGGVILKGALGGVPGAAVGIAGIGFRPH